MKRALALCAALAFVPARAGIITYVENEPASNQPCPTERCDALGYPVPKPVDSQTPVDGFRSYSALQARLQDLATVSARIERQTLGQTQAGRDIYAYVLSSGDSNAEGFRKPALLVNANIHAREWAAPEVAAGLIERFAAQENDGGLYRWLLDNARLIVIPNLNVDGFLQTQRYPDTALETEFVTGAANPDGINGDPADWPRDGRMRRKNMHCTVAPCADGRVDENLDVGGDGMYGTDNNRNNAPYFDSGDQNSDDPRSLIYHGEQSGQEHENQALYAAAALGPAARLRLFVDLHSYSQIFFGVNTGSARHNQMARSLHGVMNGATGNQYPYSPTPANEGIGSTDEYFAYHYQVPAYTLEIEPASDGDYGFGVTHAGFVLPESEIARVRSTLDDALVAGIYRMAGPPSIRAAQIRRRDDGQIVYAAHWERISETARRLVQDSAPVALQADTDYTLWLAFNKAMRVRDGKGRVAQFPGQNVPLAPAISIAGSDAGGAAFSQPLSTAAGGWLHAPGGAPAGALAYADDAYTTDFRLPSSTPLAGARRVNLLVSAQDLAGQNLDANPATALDFAQPPDAGAGGWLRYEDGNGDASTDSGGADPTLRLVDDGSGLFGSGTAPQPGTGGGGALDLFSLTVLLAGWRSARITRLRRSTF